MFKLNYVEEKPRKIIVSIKFCTNFRLNSINLKIKVMKTYYPYFNLFYKDGTNDYHIEMIVKIPGKCYKEEIVQSLVGEYWEVRLKLIEKIDEQETVDKIEEYRIKLTPEDPKQLDKIKIIVKNYDNLLRNGDPDGEGKTGSGNGEIEP